MTVNVSQVFQAAFEHHQAGRFDEAEALYRQVLAVDPRHADALHLAGVVAHQRGQQDRAAELIGRAIELRGDAAHYHANLAEVFRMQDKLAEAQSALRRSLELDPGSHRAWNNLGIVLAAQAQPAAAIEAFQRAIQLCPQYPEPHGNLGTVWQGQGKLPEAIAAYRQALALNPQFVDALSNLGAALRSQARLPEAADAYRQAIRLAPERAALHLDLAEVHLEARQFEQALACAQRALALEPGLAAAHFKLGVARAGLGDFAQAAAAYARAAQLDPHSAAIHNNLSTALSAMGDLAGAERALDAALSLDPELAEAHFNRSTLRLGRGDYTAWSEYEWRWRIPALCQPPPGRAWRGEPLAGRTILLYTEQGLGDALQFVRYAPLVKARGAAAVLVNCPRRMIPILSTCAGIDGFCPTEEPLPFYDFQAPLLSLPGVFHTDEASIPADVPYLAAPPELVARWRASLSADDRFRVGINWQGRPEYREDALRSMALARFAPLAEVAGVRLISLQKGAGSEQLAAAPFAVEDLGSRLDLGEAAFCETAAVIRNLDLVITSDTALAHLAGALAAPVWVALGRACDWRWQLNERTDSPWYPTMRLFRQQTLGAWNDVFERMAGELRSQVATRRAAP